MVPAKLAELPAAFVAVLHAKGFVEAFFITERGRYVARQILPDGRREELEYDDVLHRCLTVAERTAELPPAQRTTLADEGVTVSTTYFLDPETHQLRSTVEVVDDAGTKLASTTRLVNVNTAWDDNTVVQQALQRRRFPAEYASWSREQRIAHWATLLHRYRRARGESGRDEDEIYTPELVRDLERTEPHLRDMLREILTQVGALEQTPAADAIAAFTARTGVAIR